jgi:hypothetical protein
MISSRFEGLALIFSKASSTSADADADEWTTLSLDPSDMIPPHEDVSFFVSSEVIWIER